MSVDRADVMEKLVKAAAAAAEVVMKIYAESDPGVELKGPNDPVTRADKEANALLLEHLARDFPGVPLVAEESAPETYAGFGAAPCAIFVDPVDGTREFIAKNGEFAVMLGFAEAGVPTVGVVDCCAFGEVFAAAEGIGAFRIAGGARERVHVSDVTDLARARCAVSRSHRTEAVEEKLARLGLAELCPLGGAGIKAVRVATGAIELYAHPSGGPVKLWDACAPDAIVRAAGGVYTDARGRVFDYRGPYAQNEGTVAGNPILHAEAVERFNGT
ncbi:MAG: 3'(2'),5'-bisphosphate nucleotidase CysQ [Labilithrix sp.]|nr:3'(2'),5'-bisphosphate nucleotidase CysQ [Labilithrix sp.]MCW5809825.1 3'(2'),5'-bisphosphate nucleotidase CysQ [Labilithrix sp.]